MAQQTLDPPAAEPRQRRGATFWVGVALLVSGAGVLAYVAWQFFGTNLVAHQRQRQIVARTETIWAAKGKHAAAASLHGAQALVRIPRFGRDYVVPVQQGVGDTVLAEGFGHFDGTARPGQVGNYAIAAHRVTHGEPLRGMPSLRPGDKVVVETRRRTFTYRLDTFPTQLIVTFNDIWVISPLPRNPRGGVQPVQAPGQRLITLTTCSELFHTDNRMIAFGHLVSSRAR